ncbi:MAG: S-methyl-5'-thioadenosine phosphorylase [Firmicutes bacterium]|nr:S-methyl-5'-thioadenosine phosphorylase [Bacillota bacterium]
MARLALIGGTGVYDPSMLANIREEVVSTDYGSVQVSIGSFQGVEVVFMQRHGAGHTVPPHMINYRANIMALKELGVTKIVATSAVGSLNEAMKPGDFVLLNQFIDFTKNRPFTFFDGKDGTVVHTDFTTPYCGQMRQLILGAAQDLRLDVHAQGCYVCVEGPRFETPAEIVAFGRLGGDVVGMTNVPEVVLAREAGICYAVIAMVTNYAAGISPTPLTHEEVVEVMQVNARSMRDLVMAVLGELDPKSPCLCSGNGGQ